jgi:hypothetical protein
MPKRVFSSEDHLRLSREALLIEEQELLKSLAAVRQKIRAVDKLLGLPEQADTSSEFIYVRMQFINAFVDFLDRTGRPQKEDDLIKAVISRGAYVGRGKGAKGSAEDQARKSIKYWLMPKTQKQQIYGNRIKDADPKLRKVEDLIGLAEWPDEKFR